MVSKTKYQKYQAKIENQLIIETTESNVFLKMTMQKYERILELFHKTCGLDNVAKASLDIPAIGKSSPNTIKLVIYDTSKTQRVYAVFVAIKCFQVKAWPFYMIYYYAFLMQEDTVDVAFVIQKCILESSGRQLSNI